MSFSQWHYQNRETIWNCCGFNNQDKEISLHPLLLLLPPPITAPPRASKCSKFGKVWLWSQLPHNTWSLVSQRTGGMKEKKEWKKHTLFHNQPFSLWPVCFLFMSRSTLSGNLRLQKTLFIIPFSLWKAQFNVFCVCCLGRLVLFVWFCALHVGFLSIQCGCLARELHTLQIQPEELHGYQRRGLRPCGESC